MDPLRPGKLPSELLATLLASVRPSDPRVIVGPGIGLDAAVLDAGDRLLVAKTDPITFATDEIGWYAVQINANDVATTGATPRWFLASVLLPDRATEATARAIVEQIHRACAAIGVSLVGGHTEITHGLDRPIVAGVMLGEVERDRLVTPSGARPGDRLVLTKGLAVEGTAIAAREKAARLRDLGEPFLDRCRAFLTDPGIGVLVDARVATEAGRVHAMHDPTEGGLATGLAEMAAASGLDLVVDPDTVPVLPETRRICDALGLDPWGLIASGSLLIAVEPGDTGAIVEALGGRGIPARDIGRFVEGTGRAYLETGSTRREAPRFDRDEIARLFD